MDTVSRGLRIGQISALTGVTARAIRHYHSVGALPEPGRDSAGYRRYRASDVVALVRIRRLRAFGMPLDEIAGQLASQDDDRQALRQLADEIGREITELQALRAGLLAALASEAGGPPRLPWVPELSLPEADAAPSAPAKERMALELIGALHPRGVEGATHQAAQVLDHPAKVAAFGVLIERFRALDEAADPVAVSSLAADFVAAMPRPEGAAQPVPVEQMDALLGDRLNGAQRACMFEFRRRICERDR
jgi:DNA-binding transcriptional MerR regulator